MQMKVNEFKKVYKDFLITVTKHTVNVANKYVSYINKACRLPGMNDFWGKLVACEDTATRTKCVEELCDSISASLSATSCLISEKDLRDSQSSAHVLLAFVSGQTWTKHKGVTIKFTAIYNKKALRSKFLSRLTTQDRIYSFGSFPINIINGIARRKSVCLFDKMIDEIKFIYDDKGNYTLFKDIDRVMIASDNHSYFEKKGAIYPIFTQCPNTIPFKYVMMYSSNIEDLSLDHDVPIENVLRKTINTMPELIELSKDIWKFKQAYSKNHKGTNNRTVLAEYKKYMVDIAEDVLLEEIKAFINRLSLTIMQRNFNSSKGKKL